MMFNQRNLAVSTMRYIAIALALFSCICTVIAETPPAFYYYESPEPAPPPETDFPIPPPAESPETDFPRIDYGLFDVTEHGAIANGDTESSSAFLKAWVKACAYPGESTMYIPEGSFLLGPVKFSGPCYNNQSPKVEVKGTLIALTSLEDFLSPNWIVFENLYGFNLSGANNVGVLNGRGEVEAWKQASCVKSDKCEKLVTSLRFMNVSYGAISDIKLSNSKGFNVGIHGCDNIRIYNVRIKAPWYSPNTDGIHISHSTNINITFSDIGVGDDCISIGPGSFNISVSQVTCGPGHGISVGSLGKYPRERDVIGIIVRNCTINGTQNGIRVKTWPGAPGSNASNFTFEDIFMINVSNPIIIDQEYCPSHRCNISQPSLVKISNISIKNISGTYTSKVGATFLCSSEAEAACENIRLADIHLNYSKPQKYSRQGRFTLKGAVDGFEILRSTF